MDQTGIQAKVAYGYLKAATYLGATFTQYRPDGPANPISDANQIATLKAAFDPDAKFSFAKPSGYGKPVYFGLFDPSHVQVGDYLVHDTQGTYFLAGFEPIKPPMCVQCNRTLTFTRPGPPKIGPNAYGGPLPSDAVVMLTAWPASVLKGTKGDKGDTGTLLPGDVRQAWVEILLPSVGGVQIRAGDQIVDDQAIPMHYTVSGAELTDLGYRIEAAGALT